MNKEIYHLASFLFNLGVSITLYHVFGLEGLAVLATALVASNYDVNSRWWKDE